MHRSISRAVVLLPGVAFTVCAPTQAPGTAPDVESRSAPWSLLLDLVTAELDKPEINHAVIRRTQSPPARGASPS